MALSDRNRKKLIELLEIGVERSASRLAKISKTEWETAVASTREIAEERLLAAYSAGKQASIGARLTAQSGLKGEFVLIFPEKNARALAEAMISEYSWEMKDLSNILDLATGEVSNVVAQSVIGAMADRFSLMINLSVPVVSRGSKEELLCGFLADCDDPKKVLLMSHIELFSGSLTAECSMVFLFEEEVVEMHLSAG